MRGPDQGGLFSYIDPRLIPADYPPLVRAVLKDA